MDLEEQTLHYYLKVFSFFLTITAILTSLFIFNIFNKDLKLKQNPIKINKGERIEDVLKKNILNLSNSEIMLIKTYIKINHLINNKYFHYGDFNIENDISLIDFINIISKPSNVLIKITIVEGWSKYQLEEELSKYFSDFKSIPYQDIIADTYFFQKNTNFNSFLEKLKKTKVNYFKTYENSELLKKYNENDLMIIGSLLEKEGLDQEDKKKIYSVIMNRLNKKMKLQIDATVLFAITDGKYDLKRKLLRSDLKINHSFNTYLHPGLPPQPISYVGRKTLDVLFENNKTDFLFYFFNYSLKRHIFSKTFKEHKNKLNEYRKK